MLIIYVHPNRDGSCGKMLSLVEEGLKARGSKYKIMDLYKEGFDPVLSANERKNYDEKIVSEDVLKIQKEFAAHQQYIFIYPSWWNNMPAMLKGFIDRVFSAGFALDNSSKFPKGILKGKALILSTCAGPMIFQYLIGKRRVVKNLKTDILGFCGLKTKAILTTTGTNYKTTNEPKIQKAVNKGLAYIL